MTPGMRVYAGPHRGPVYIIRAIDAGEAWVRGEANGYGNVVALERLRPADAL